jgi:hypothetical protein
MIYCGGCVHFKAGAIKARDRCSVRGERVMRDARGCESFRHRPPKILRQKSGENFTAGNRIAHNATERPVSALGRGAV